LTAKLHSRYIKASESVSKFSKGRSWSRAFYLRRRNPGFYID